MISICVFYSLVGCLIFIPEYSQHIRNTLGSISGRRGWKAGLTYMPSHLSLHSVESVSLIQTQAKTVVRSNPIISNNGWRLSAYRHRLVSASEDISLDHPVLTQPMNW